MPKGCPIFRFAYLLAKAFDKDIDVKEARCMETYCELWVVGEGCCIKRKPKPE